MSRYAIVAAILVAASPVLADVPTIESVQDVADDFGLQVTVLWQASSLDVPGSGEPITGYAIFRQNAGNSPSDPATGAYAGSGSVQKLAGWTYLETVPAYTEAEYAVVASTLADDTPASFLVRALTAQPGVFYDSAPASGSSTRQLVPNVPVAKRGPTGLASGAMRSVPGGMFVEDFSTTLYRDPATTALWDTASGRLQLMPFVPFEVGSLATGGFSSGIVVDGDQIYMTDSNQPARVIDISDVTNPTEIGQLGTQNFTRAIDLQGDDVYVADGYAGVSIFDVGTVVGGHALVGSYNPVPFVQGVTVAGDRAFVACPLARELHVLDISDPTSPSLLDVYGTADEVVAVAVEERVAYLAVGQAGVEVVAILPSGVVAGVQVHDTPGTAASIAVDGDYAFLADRDGGVRILSVTGGSLAFVGSLATTGEAWDCWVDGDQLYVAAGTQGLLVVDVSNPASPTILHEIALGTDLRAVRGDSEHLYVADWSNSDGLHILRKAYPGQLPSQPLGGMGIDPRLASESVIDGNLLYAPSSFGISVWDVSDPLAATSLATVSGGRTAILQRDGYLLFSAYTDPFDVNPTHGLKMWSLSDPGSPQLLDQKLPGVPVRTLEAKNGLLIIASAAGGTYLFDYSSPALALTLLGSMSAVANDIEIVGDLAFFAGQSLTVVDIADPSSPAAVSTLSLPSPASRWARQGNLAYALGTREVHVLDMSILGAPSLVTSFPLDLGLEDLAYDFLWDGNLLYVSATWNQLYDDPGAELLLYDVSDPMAPVLLQHVASEFFPDLQVVGDHIFSLAAVFRAFTRSWDVSANEAISTTFAQPAWPVDLVRLTTATAQGVQWEISADGGTHWKSVLPGEWTSLDYPGTELRWRAQLFPLTDGSSAIVDDLTVEWRPSTPLLLALTDVPDDQGGQLEMSYQRSGRDEAAMPELITHYSIYRYLEGATPWHFVTTVPAFQEDETSLIVPTLVDASPDGGSGISEFFVRAGTANPAIYYDSNSLTAFSVDNLEPAVPADVVADYGAGATTLSWSPAQDEDLRYYSVYRGPAPGFAPTPENLVARTTDPGWVDPEPNPWGSAYVVTSTDFAGNESAGGEPSVITGLAAPPTSGRLAVVDVAPNPFNPTTTIRFDLPRSARVEIVIYDARGRAVETVLDEDRVAGRHRIQWNARGHASGVYYCALRAEGRTVRAKLTIVQ